MGSKQEQAGGLLQGTLDMMVLKALKRGAMHGYDVAEFIFSTSGDVLKVEEGALYPALHRLELKGWIEGEWGLSANNRRAKFYRLTAAGRRQLESERVNWMKMAGAVARVMEA